MKERHDCPLIQHIFLKKGHVATFSVYLPSNALYNLFIIVLCCHIKRIHNEQEGIWCLTVCLNKRLK